MLKYAKPYFLEGLEGIFLKEILNYNFLGIVGFILGQNLSHYGEVLNQ